MSRVEVSSELKDSPYLLENGDAYQQWRDAKLYNYPASINEIIVEVNDPRQLSDAEYLALLEPIRKTNMVIYVSGTGDNPDKSIPRLLGERLGLRRLNHNWLADDDGITSLAVNPEGEHPHYIPYTNRPIKWHTDGYYNPEDRQIHGLMLHCVHPAAEGGENALLDNDIAYIRLRDKNPDYIRALMQSDAMTIPPGTDMNGRPRGASVGPVFAVRPDGELHMRYTARKRNIEWKDDPLTAEAVAALEQLLESDLNEIYHGRLESGMGLICNNVLHDRSGFSDRDNAYPRLLYRSRYYDRVAGTGYRYV
jgi:alpha-ketoglutarate-dependent taurine dioxygenase